MFTIAYCFVVGFALGLRQQQYLFATVAGNQKGQLPIKAGSLFKGNTN